MGSPTPTYLLKQTSINDVLRGLDLPLGISYKFEISPEADNSKRDFPGSPKGAKVFTTQPPDVVNFYSDKNKIVGRVYFTRDPVEVQSLDGMFAETETSLRERLGL